MPAFARLAALLLLLFASAAAAAPVASVPTYHGVAVDRSTPERNLKTFLEATDRLAFQLEAREWARNFYDAWLYPEITPQQAADINLLKDTALDSMDLSALPDWRRETAGLETALMIRELLRSKKIRKDSSFRKLHDGLWSLPGTYLQAGALTTGLHAGDVVFTADTLANVPSLYSAQLPSESRKGMDAYQLFTDTPGGLDPPRWAGVAFKLPSFLRLSIGSNTIFQWGLAVVAIGGFVGLTLLAGILGGRGSKRLFLSAITAALLAKGASSLILDDAGLSGWSATAVTLMFVAIRYVALAVIVLILGEWLGNWLVKGQKAHNKSFYISIVRLVARVISAVGSLSIVIYGISTMGVPVFGIIAGFGVGGLAVALATKQTLENILAGFILFLDGSVKVGDDISLGNFSGVTEDIGMRFTRIRATDGSLIIVTNSELANTAFKNLPRRALQGPDLKK